MEQGIGPVHAVAARVSEVRKRKDLTAAEVGRRMTEQGVKWDRFTVANLESGKRQNVSLVEWLALARVLDVSPLHLLVPLENVDFQVTPQETVSATSARDWIRGFIPLPGTDRRIFRSEVPLDELGEGKLRPATEEEKRIARQALGMPEKGEADGE